MTTIDPSGYSEAGAHLFTWLADKALGGAKKAFGWGWERAQWAAAQDRYDSRIIKDYGHIRIFGQTTPKSLKDIFTDVYVLDKPTAYRRLDPETIIEHLWREDRSIALHHKDRRAGEQLLNEGRKFFILGKPGAGKTTFLKYLAVREAQRGRWGVCLGKIPIFVSLKQMAEEGKSPFQYIVQEFAVCGFPNAEPFLDELLRMGKALVLFDGLDEVSKGEGNYDRGKITQTLEQFSRRYNDCHVVITCRIAAVEYTLPPPFKYVEMADFAPDQVEAFVRAWFWDESDKEKSVVLAEGMLMEWAKPEHVGVRDLARNPLLLTLLCLNYAETLGFPPLRVEIYREALDALMKRWDASRNVKRGSSYRTLSPGRKQQMLARIAFDTMARNEILFPQVSLESWLIDYLTKVPELPAAIDIDGEIILHEIVAQHGIFVEQAHRLFSFAHLTFQEYYAARYIVDNVALGAQETLLTHWNDDKWREVYLLAASLMSDATEFLSRFEGLIHQIAISGGNRLVSWLSWIDQRAAESDTDSSRLTIRLIYAQALARELVASSVLGTFNSGLLFDLALDIAFDLNMDLALASFASLVHGDSSFASRARHSDYKHADFCSRRHAISETREAVLDICVRKGRLDLYEAIVALGVPDASGTTADWLHYATQLNDVSDVRDGFAKLQGLQEEVDVLVRDQIGRWSLYDIGEKALTDYIYATKLFYDCLKVAYTPDRRAFEERIFLPPP